MPRGKYIAAMTGECAAQLVYSVNLVQPGRVSFTYQYTDDDAVFHFTVLIRFHIYRPQTKFAKVMFLQVSVCPWGEYLGRYTPQAGTPPRQVHPLGRYTPQATVHAGIWSTSRRYASHWNAFLLKDTKTVTLMLSVNEALEIVYSMRYLVICQY